jgi:hypothetical protein
MKQQEIEDLNLAGKGSNGGGEGGEEGVPGESEGDELLNKTDNEPDKNLIVDDKKKSTKKKSKMICDKDTETKKEEE